MVFRAVGEDAGIPIVFLGMTPENMSNLREGLPIKVNLKNLIPGQVVDLPDINVVVFFAGEEEQRLLREAYENGWKEGINEAVTEANEKEK